MDDTIIFLVYCIELYKAANDLSGKEVIKLFEKYDVNSFIKYNYEALHTISDDYIVDDIRQYINNRS